MTLPGYILWTRHLYSKSVYGGRSGLMSCCKTACGTYMSSQAMSGIDADIGFSQNQSYAGRFHTRSEISAAGDDE